MNNLDFVDRYYVMDPLEDELIYDGTGLVEGMRVLIDRTEDREDIPADVSTMTSSKMDKARWNNRWCTIKRIEVRNDHVSFIAVYDDHTTKKRIFNVHFPWLVKIHSIPAKHLQKHDAVYKMVYQGLQYQDSLAGIDEANLKMNESMTARAGIITEKILDLF